MQLPFRADCVHKCVEDVVSHDIEEVEVVYLSGPQGVFAGFMRLHFHEGWMLVRHTAMQFTSVSFKS